MHYALLYLLTWPTVLQASLLITTSFGITIVRDRNISSCTGSDAMKCKCKVLLKSMSRLISDSRSFLGFAPAIDTTKKTPGLLMSWCMTSGYWSPQNSKSCLTLATVWDHQLICRVPYSYFIFTANLDLRSVLTVLPSKAEYHGLKQWTVSSVIHILEPSKCLSQSSRNIWLWKQVYNRAVPGLNEKGFAIKWRTMCLTVTTLETFSTQMILDLALYSE